MNMSFDSEISLEDFYNYNLDSNLEEFKKKNSQNIIRNDYSYIVNTSNNPNTNDSSEISSDSGNSVDIGDGE